MAESTVQKLALPALIAMVVGSMIGSGIFTLPSRFAVIILRVCLLRQYHRARPERSP